MKTLLVAINSKFIHSSLSVWYLKSACGEECGEIHIAEFTINDSIDAVFSGIYEVKADVVAFSCYIWNISFVLTIAENLKKVSPGIRIVLGGPEVSFGGLQLLRENPSIDYVLSGEGEETFKQLLRYICYSEGALENISGLAFRAGESLCGNEAFALIEKLDALPSPYTEEMLSGLENRIVYYEASRGCPFACSYCISSTFNGIRYFSLERVKQDLDKLIDSGVRQIKFVDRTFNCSKQRAKDIFSYIIGRIKTLMQKDPRFFMNFHFEAAADLFDEEMFDMLSESPAGIIQFEIGVQTTNLHTLELISRKTDMEKVFYNVKRLKALGNIHMHLDLIAGLPGEGYAAFSNSFNQVYGLKPDQLQLGFLKMLKGSRIRREAEEHGYSFRTYAPYEILQNNCLTFDELLELKGVEDILERYYNSGRFASTVEFITRELYSSPFEFYKALAEYMKLKGYFGLKLSSRQLYSILVEFMKNGMDENIVELANELLKFDYLSSDNSNNLPQGIERIILPGFKERCFEFLKQEENIKKYLESFIGMPAKQIYKQVHFEAFNRDVTSAGIEAGANKERIILLFDYSSRSSVTGLHRHFKLEEFS